MEHAVLIWLQFSFELVSNRSRSLSALCMLASVSEVPSGALGGPRAGPSQGRNSEIVTGGLALLCVWFVSFDRPMAPRARPELSWPQVDPLVCIIDLLCLLK